MKLHRVRLLNYGGVIESDVSFLESGVTIVEGPNEVGKTSIPEALGLAIELPDSSRKAQIKSAKPVDRDVGPEVEITLTSGEFSLVYRKRWLRSPMTTLKVTSPRSESLTGREAHDRLNDILAGTLDMGLWRALRIDQGIQLTLPPFTIPSMRRALDLAAGGDLASDREDTLWERINEEYGRYWTPSGQAKRERQSLNRRLEEAGDRVNGLKKQIRDIESDVTRMVRLLDDAVRLAATLDVCEKREGDLAERWDSVERIRNEVERLEANHSAREAERDRAASQWSQRRELINTLDRCTEDHTALESEAEKAAPELAAAIRRSEEATAARETLAAALRSAEAKRRTAIEDRDYLRQQIEVEQLRERYVRYVEAERALKEAEEYLESATVDDDVLKRIEQVYLDVERARAASDSGAASVETTALDDITFQVNSGDVELAASEVIVTPVEDEVVLVIPGIARMMVSAGPESKALAEGRRDTQDAYRRLCEEFSVADIHDARRAAEERRDARRNRKEAVKAIERDLRDLTPDVLQNKVKNLTRKVSSYPKERPKDTPLPSDFEEAQRIASEAESLVSGCQTEFQTCEDAAKKVEVGLNEARLKEAGLAARIEIAGTSKEEAARRLAAARAIQPDEGLSAAVVVAAECLDGALESLQGVEAQLNAADPDTLETLFENARDARKRATQELQSNRESQSELRVSLDLRGEEGLQGILDEALSEMQQVKREHESMEARAMAVRLLQETFDGHRREAHLRYVEPFKERIDQLGRIVFGPTFAVELDEELRVVRRTLHSTTLGVDQLSTGALEQLGVLSRLACAAIVSPDDGGVPVMIDDALGWSDPQRLQGMGAAIAAAGKKCQVVVLTCTPGRYSHVGNAKVVSLGG